MNGTKEPDGRTLVVAPSWIGDAVLSQPLLARLAAQRPASAIDVFAPKWVLPAYGRMPEVANTIENPFVHGQLALVQRRRVGRDLAQHGYSHAYVLPNSFKSALVPWFAGIGKRMAIRTPMYCQTRSRVRWCRGLPVSASASVTSARCATACSMIAGRSTNSDCR
jgi:lipopolysaccharide heptosyltransferase II